ncbi:gephyrin-like molybdotransferase receptor GlpR, partial [Mycobacterium sp. IS-836]|uniref:divisome protein SepX/GlpR n=1 Tax=Mycobacterium sp. IS-836 TaxID=1834160 RepID=UPI00350F18D2
RIFDDVDIQVVGLGLLGDLDLQDDRYEYVDDSSGLEPEEDPEDDAEARAAVASPGLRRQRRYDSKTAAAVSARKYAFRKRVLMVMAVVLVGSATAAFKVSPTAWWVCGSATAVTVLYLGYLRRQTRIEEKVRRRRMQRMARARLGVENAYEREYDVVPSRLRRPGAVVLEIDDEDPIFEHLDYAMPMRNYGWPRDLPRAVGE